jgi:hypothetical protein
MRDPVSLTGGPARKKTAKKEERNSAIKGGPVSGTGLLPLVAKMNYFTLTVILLFTSLIFGTTRSSARFEDFFGSTLVQIPGVLYFT